MAYYGNFKQRCHAMEILNRDVKLCICRGRLDRVSEQFHPWGENQSLLLFETISLTTVFSIADFPDDRHFSPFSSSSHPCSSVRNPHLLGFLLFLINHNPNHLLRPHIEFPLFQLPAVRRPSAGLSPKMNLIWSKKNRIKNKSYQRYIIRESISLWKEILSYQPSAGLSPKINIILS